MKCLVTGAAGFVGGSIARGLHHAGHEVLGVDRLPAQDSLFSSAVIDLSEATPTDLFRQFDPDAIVHAAGPASVTLSMEQPRTEFRGSTLPWIAILDAARLAAKNARIVLISSAAAYGQPETLPISEQTPDRPISPYGYHRHICETLAESYATNFGLHICALRLFSTFGPSQRRLLVWELFSQALGEQDSVTLHGTGKEVRDYVFEADLPRIVESVLMSESMHRRVNVASGRALTTRDLAEAVTRACGVNKSITCLGQTRSGDPDDWRVDNTLLLKMHAPTRLTTLETGLELCASEWKSVLSTRL